MLMKIHPVSGLVAIVLLALISFGCDNPAPTPEPGTPADSSGMSTSGAMKFQGELFSIPSPVHTAMLMQKANVQYNESLMHKPDLVKNYVQQLDQALNLGIYGADLAYLSNFSKPQMSQQYFSVVGNLANSLDILSNIDQKLVRRFNDNISSRDSLLKLTADFYKEGDRYLKNNERQQVAAFILLGGWVEALHLACDAAATNADIRSKVGEQHAAVKSIASVIAKFDDPQSKELAAKLARLETTFGSLTSTYQYKKPITDSESKTTFLLSTTTVTITDSQLAEISSQVSELRNSIIQ